MSIPTRQTILELSEMSPALHNAITYWRAGAITWEQAMMLAVMELDLLSKHYQIELELHNETIRE